MRDYRFHGFNPAGAAALAAALSEDGFVVMSVAPATDPHDGWTVEARGDAMSEGLLEVLAQFYGGRYEGEGMSFA